MKKIIIHRLGPDEIAPLDMQLRTFGVMVLPRFGGTPPHVLHTLERAWLPHQVGRGGEPNNSCVPLGTYDLVRRVSPKHHEQWHLVNPDLDVFLLPDDRQHDYQRWGCMFHPANYWHQLKGCIAPGKSFWWANSRERLAVGSSGAALAIIDAYLEGETAAQLEVK